MFPDDQRKMNLSLIDIEGELLIVPQVTLAIETNKGNRPSFSKAADPEKGEELFEELNKENTKPKVKQKIRNELVRRGIKIVKRAITNE